MTQEAGSVKRFIAWIDSHPRVGWWIAFVATLDLLLQIGEAFGIL